MVGQPGWELFGPWEDGEAVREALLSAGEELGLRQAGARAYSSNTLESGWIPSPLPAVYSGESLRAYREWLPATGYEGSASIGGSFASDEIEDYYFTPWDLGYGSYVKLDHDFIGREALERIAKEEHRRKVTLALDDDDLARTIGTMFGKSERAKFIDWPSAVYSMHPYDKVTVGGNTVGVFHVDRLQRQRGQDADPGGARRRVREAGHGGDVRLGRGGRWFRQAHRRAPRADGDTRGCQPRSVTSRRSRSLVCARSWRAGRV